MEPLATDQLPPTVLHAIAAGAVAVHELCPVCRERIEPGTPTCVSHQADCPVATTLIGWPDDACSCDTTVTCHTICCAVCHD